MRRINISVIDGDTTLQAAQNNISGESLVGGAFAVHRGSESIDGVREVVVGETGDLQVDLIAHARDGELHVGEWLITAAETAAAAILSAVPAGRIQQIRLLGCFTALTPEGYAAMKHLKDLGYPKVFGTTTILGSRHFGPNGLLHDFMAAELDDLQPPPLAQQINWSEAFGSMRQVPNADLGALVAETRVQAQRDVSKFLGPSQWPLREVAPSHALSALLGTAQDVREEPGLLQLPDAELLFPASQAGHFHRVTSLFGGKWLRVYPASYPKGVIVRPMAPLPL